MKFFRRDKMVSDNSVADDLIRTYAKHDSRSADVSKDDLSVAQDAVLALTSQFKNGAEAQQVAAKRMSALNKTMAKMETRMRQFDRVEADNHKMAKELRNLSQKIKQKTLLSEEQEKNLIEIRRQRDDFRSKLELAKKSLSQSEDQESSTRSAVSKQAREIEVLQTEIAQRDEAIQTLELLQQNFREELSEAASDLAAERHLTLELQKSTEELSMRLADKTQSSDKAMTELKTLQMRNAEQKEKLFTLKGKVQSLTYNLESQKNGYDDTIKRREDEILVLKNQNEQLNTQLKIKDNMTSHFDDELEGLRAALDAERSRATRESNALHNKSAELERHNLALVKSKAEYEALQAKFTTAMEDLDTLRKLCNIQTQKLERYAAISSGATGQVFVHPEGAPGEKDYSPRLKAV